MRIILNPMARHGAGRRLRPAIERELDRRGVAYDIVESEGPGHAAELAQEAVRAGYARVVAAGGDGTVHEVANGLMSAAGDLPALGLIPIGTGNDFVKMVPGTATPELAVLTLATGRDSLMDVGRAEWDGGTEYFMNAVGTGIDTEVVRGMRRSRFLPGGVIYVSALLRALVRYRPLGVRLDVDGDSGGHRIMSLAVCNGPSVGGSFRICPDARADDGLLDVCIVAEMPLHRNVRMVPRVLRGTHSGQPGVTMLRGARVTLRMEDGSPLAFQLDGELREAQHAAGVAISLDERRIRVIRAFDGTVA